MDSDIELVEDDIPDSSQVPDECTDFSQVQIVVHGGDVAVKLIEGLFDRTDQDQEYHTEHNEHTEDDVQEILDSPDEIPEDNIAITSGQCETIPEHAKTILEHPETIPEHAETIPGHAETIPEHAKTILEHPETIPEQSETIPGHAETILEHAATIPEHTETILDCAKTVLEHPEKIPKHAETIPKHAEATPEHAETISVQAKTLPEHAETILDCAKTVLEHPEKIPKHAEKIPKHAEATPEHAETIPVQAKTLPEHAETIPVQAKTLPEHAETIAVHAKTIPEHAETIPEHVETIPKHAEATPEHAVKIPKHAETIPEHAKTIPECTETVPAVHTGAEDCMDCSEMPINEELEQFDGTNFTDFGVPEISGSDLPPEEINHSRNKIILGSRPRRRKVPALVENDLPPEDIYHFKNKIILGTKPCQNTSSVDLQPQPIVDTEKPLQVNDVCQSDDIRKEYLDAVVLVEDFGPRLKQSSRFCCMCGILFPTSMHLETHNKSAHSLLVVLTRNVATKSTTRPALARKSTSPINKNNKNIARKSTGGDSVLNPNFCNHCNKIFPDHKALIKHLYELIPLSHFKSGKSDAEFNAQKDLVSHNLIHIEAGKNTTQTEKVVPRKKLFEEDLKKKKLVTEKNTTQTEKVVPRKKLFEEDLKKKKLVTEKNTTQTEEVVPRKNLFGEDLKKIRLKEIEIIPMSVLFHCTKCDIHFLSVFAGLQHWTHICHLPKNGKEVTSCKTCKRMIRTADRAAHKIQHELCTKFKVYKITYNVYDRTICECPKCGVHFKEKKLKLHIENCSKVPTSRCQKCNILIPRCDAAWHLKKHITQSLKPDDFIVVRYHMLNKAVKRKLAPIATPAKRIKLEFPSTKPSKKGPSLADKNSKKNVAKKINKKSLTKPMNISVKMKKGDNRKMVNRLRFETGNKIKMFFCVDCNECAVSSRLFHWSKQCKYRQSQDKVLCSECGLQFSKRTLKSHKIMHRNRSFTVHDMVFYHVVTHKPIIPSFPEYPQCKHCKIKFLTAAAQIQHICGKDYNTCNLCGEKFHNSAYSIHMEFHKLIKTAAPKNKGAKMLPEPMQKYVSLNMMSNIVFSCSKCDIITDLYDKAIEHSQGHLKNEMSTKSIECYICNLNFDETSWSKHSELHSQKTINKKDLKILIYNPNKLLSEEWYQLFDSIPEQQIKQIKDGSLYGYERGVKMKLLKDGLSEFTLYCCSICNVCCPNDEITKHLEILCRNTANYCRICDIPFIDINNLRKHEILHLKGVAKDGFRVVVFTKVKTNKEQLKFKISTPTFELFKCKECKSCVSHKSNLIKHKCSNIDTWKVNCTKCKEQFHNNAMFKHKLEHKMHPELNWKNLKIHLFDPHIKGKYKKRNCEKPTMGKVKAFRPTTTKPHNNKTTRTMTKTSEADTSKTGKTETKIVKLYRCNCGLHYTSVNTIEKHVRKCCPDDEISKENCSKCGLLFPKDILVSHLCKHHGKNTTILIEAYRKSEESEQSSDSDESTSATIPKPRRKTRSITRKTKRKQSFDSDESTSAMTQKPRRKTGSITREIRRKQSSDSDESTSETAEKPRRKTGLVTRETKRKQSSDSDESTSATIQEPRRKTGSVTRETKRKQSSDSDESTSATIQKPRRKTGSVTRETRGRQSSDSDESTSATIQKPRRKTGSVTRETRGRQSSDSDESTSTMTQQPRRKTGSITREIRRKQSSDSDESTSATIQKPRRKTGSVTRENNKKTHKNKTTRRKHSSDSDEATSTMTQKPRRKTGLVTRETRRTQSSDSDESTSTTIQKPRRKTGSVTRETRRTQSSDSDESSTSATTQKPRRKTGSVTRETRRKQSSDSDESTSATIQKPRRKTGSVTRQTRRTQSSDSDESTSTTIQKPRGKTGSVTREIKRKREESVSSSLNCEVTLYKCGKCEIYFLIQSTCYRHVYMDHQKIDKRHYIECKWCGLQFTVKSLTLHILRHHQGEFSLDKVFVQEYFPPVGNGRHKIDSYIAAERLQSFQVTSSKE